MRILLPLLALLLNAGAWAAEDSSGLDSAGLDRPGLDSLGVVEMLRFASEV